MSTMEQRLTMEQRKSFLIAFAKSKGPPQIIALVVFFSIGYGATAGIVPGLMSERYARLNYGYNGTAPCSSYPPASQPEACVDGNNESQRILTYSNLVGNLIAFLTGSMVGSISDEFGRRGVCVCGCNVKASLWLSSVLSALCVAVIITVVAFPKASMLTRSFLICTIVLPYFSSSCSLVILWTQLLTNNVHNKTTKQNKEC